MESYESSARINAQPEAIWAILTDTASYATWDSGVVRVEGTIALGSTIKVYSKISPERAFPVKVTALEPHRSMVWSGGMPLGLFKGVRTFTITADGDDAARFHMREEFTGPLLGMIWKSMPNLQPSFDQFTAGLKARAEQG